MEEEQKWKEEEEKRRVDEEWKWKEEAEEWKRAERERKWKEEEERRKQLEVERQRQSEMGNRWETIEIEEDPADGAEWKRRVEARIHEQWVDEQMTRVAQAESSKQATRDFA